MRTILFITPGPNYNAHAASYQKKYKILSESFRGYILTTSSVSEEFMIGKFQYISLESNNTAYSKLIFFIFCFKKAIFFHKNKHHIDLIITYDPIRTGLLAAILSQILKCKFAPEVNGVYDSPAIYADKKNIIKRLVNKNIRSAIMKYVFYRADAVKLLFPTQLSSLINSESCLIRDFPCFVPIQQFNNISEEKVILFVGFPFFLKGVDVLIEAFKDIANDCPGWELKILGWFPDKYEMSRCIDGHPGISHHPPVKYHEMPEHIGRCAFLVLPSRTEAMGRVLVEAMAARKPVIGSNIDGIPQVIRDGINGLLFESESSEDLAEKMKFLIENPSVRKRMGLSGENMANEYYGEDLYFQKIKDFFMGILGSK